MEHPHSVQVLRVVRPVICLILIAINSEAAPLWLATYNSGSNVQDVAENIVPAGSSDLYVTGFSGPAGRERATVVKYTAAGQQLWSVENTNISKLTSFAPLPLTAVDSNDGLRLAGQWAPTGNEIALVSYSAEGSLLWERRFREGVENYAHAVAVDASSNTFVVGWCSSNAAPDALILKYAPDGALLWKRFYSFSDLSSEQAFAVTTLPNGDVLVGVGPEWEYALVLKYSADGDLLWVTESHADALTGQLIIDPFGNIVVNTVGSLDDDFVTKLDASGKVLWYKSQDISGSQIALDGEGDIYTAGVTFYGELIVTRYDPNGREKWTSHFSVHNDYAATLVGITAHQSGVSIGVGFDDSGVPANRFAAAHYSSEGVEVWRDTQFAGNVNAMAGDTGGGIYLSGSSASSGTSDFQTVKFQVAISPLQPEIIRPPQHLAIMEGTNSAVFSVEASNGPNTFQWRRRSVPIPGATNVTLELTDSELYEGGPYSVIVSNVHGYVSSPDARLRIYEPPRIQGFFGLLSNEVAVAGNQFIFFTDAVGSQPITLEWYRDGLRLPETPEILIIEQLTADDAGTYMVVARSPYGAATNRPTSLAVVERTAVDEWRWSSPRPQGNDLNAVAFGNGRFVAVGTMGALVTSRDGVDWSVTNLGYSGLTGVAFGNGTFVAVSTPGAIYSSPDGVSWTQRERASWGQRFRSVAFLNNRFVAWGYSIRSSVNGIDWTDHGSSPEFAGLAFGQGKYVMAGSGSVALSTNLSDWTEFPIGDGTTSLRHVACGRDLFVFGNSEEIYTSSDGIHISTPLPGSSTLNIQFINDRFFAVGGSIRSSTDGFTWTQSEVPSFGELNSIAYGNGTYVAVGSQGFMVRSADGETWTAASSRGPQYMRLLAYGDGKYIAVGAEGYWSSSDGQNWTQLGGALMEDPIAITYANGTFVMVGLGGDIAASRNGIDWVRTNSLATALSSVIHDGHRFVSVGDDYVLISTNGMQWHVAGSIPGGWADTISYAEGLYVVFFNGPSQQCQISTNLLNWDIIDLETAPDFGRQSLTYGDGRFVGVMGREAVLSEDGRVWTSHRISGQEEFTFVTFAGGVFVAAGGRGPVATSTNGQHWVLHQTPVWFPWGSTASYLNGALWMAGSDEGIIRTAQIEPLLRARKAGDDIELLVEAFAGRTYRLQKSTTLGNWNDFRTFTPQGETTTLIDNDADGQGAFYRVVAP
jgi:hypothetical protein